MNYKQICWLYYYAKSGTSNNLKQVRNVLLLSALMKADALYVQMKLIHHFHSFSWIPQLQVVFMQ